MSTDQTRDRLAGVLTAPLAATGLDVEAIELTPAGRRRMLRVAVDKDGGVTLDDIADATRRSPASSTTPTRWASSPTPSRSPRPAPTVRSCTRATGAATRAAWSRSRWPTAGRSPAGSSTATTTRAVVDVGGQRARGRLRRRGQGQDPDRVQPEGGLSRMDIDMTILRSLEREKEISFDILVEAIEQALLTAYHKTPGAQTNARVAARPQDRPRDGASPRRPTRRATRSRSTTTRPPGFGRIAATTAKQIILQRLRDAEDDMKFGEFSGKEGDIVSGVIQQGRDPQDVMVDLGRLEALLPSAERVPGERYEHGTRIKCLVISVRKGHARPAGDAVALAPQPGQEAVRARGARDRRRHRRDLRDRPGGRPPHQDRGAHDRPGRERQGLLHRPDGPARPQR